MKLSKSQVRSFVHAERARLVDTAKTSRISFACRMVFSRFDFDVDNAIGIRRERRHDPRDTVEALREAVPLTLTPVAPRPTRLVEAIVHGEDIRRPLGIAAAYDCSAVTAALAYQVKPAVGMGGGRERVGGVRLVATDCDFVFGSGDEVCARAVDLLLAVSGRGVGAGAFDGPGTARLTQV